MLRCFLIAVIIGWPLLLRDVSRTIADENRPTAGKPTGGSVLLEASRGISAKSRLLQARR